VCMDLIVNDTLVTSLSSSNHHHYQIHINTLIHTHTHTHTHTHIKHDTLSFVLRASLFLPLVSPLSLIVARWRIEAILKERESFILKNTSVQFMFIHQILDNYKVGACKRMFILS